MDYVHALQRGYVESEEEGIIFRVPVTRTNILHAFLSEKEESELPAAKRPRPC